MANRLSAAKSKAKSKSQVGWMGGERGCVDGGAAGLHQRCAVASMLCLPAACWP
jgi:hypothetical protein